MKVPIRFVPIEEWPGKATGFQKQSNFKSGIRDTLTLLDHELFMLGAKNVIMQAYIRPEQIRSDGSLYAGTRLARSGLILNFISKGASLSFPCDRYTKWEDNLRAIALSLEALRAVDRYGVTRGSEQYQGWRQIESSGAAPAFKSADDAARFLAIKAYDDEGWAGALIHDESARKIAYRRAAAQLHPDNLQSGSHHEFVLLQAALAVLEAK